MKVEDSSKGTSFFKRILISLFAISLAIHVAGCSSSDGVDDDASAGEETFAEESSGDFDSDEVAEGADDESVDESDVADDESEDAGSDETADSSDDETADEGDVADNDGELDSDLDSDDLAEGDDEVASNDDLDDADDSGDLSLDDDEGLPSDVANSEESSNKEPAVEEPAPEIADSGDAAAPPTDAPVFEDNSTPPSTDVAATNDSGSGDFVEPAPRVYLPLLKMKTAAFDSNGTNLNRLYVGRPGDTVSSVSEKLYGNSGRQSDLKAWNSFLRRGVKVGDKIYYQSPVNPTDGSMLTYYEEVGIAPQYYSTREGDNIRTVSQTLLGHNDSWKEIWETNMEVESKGDVPGGINLRYWPEGAAPAAPVVAQTPPIPPPQKVDPTDPVMNDHQGFDPLAMNQADQTVQPKDPSTAPPSGEDPYNPLADSTPASTDQTVAGTTEAVPPPPPEEPPSAPPPPPPVPDQHTQAAAAPDTSADEADQMMQMGLAGVVLLVAGAIFFLMKRNRSRKVDLTQTTQVG